MDVNAYGRARRAVALAVLGTGFAVGGLAAVAMPSVSAKALPPGCNQGYEGQAYTVAGGHTNRFVFEGYNVVAPGHRVTRARISWGDGKTAAARIGTRSKQTKKGCTTTTFTARHTYRTPTKCSGSGVCTKTYNVRVTFRDAKTHAKHAMSRLRVLVVKPAK